MEYHIAIFVVFGVFLPWINAGHTYQMQDYCGRQLSMVLQSAYQLELELTDNYIYKNWFNTKQLHTCEITVSAYYSLYPKLVFQFDDLDIDCKNGHLEFYVGETGETRVTGLEKDICGHKEPKDTFTVDTRYFRIRYVPTKSQYIKEVFSVTITAYTDGTCPVNSHRCENSRCIDKSIDCEDIGSDTNACDDESDDCDTDASNITGTVIGATIGGLCLLGFITCLILCVICCKRTSRKSTVENQYQQSPVAVASTGQDHRYNQPTYNVCLGGSYQTMQPSNPLTSSGALPTAPEVTGQQYSYQGPAELFSYEEIPMSPPAYSEIFGQPSQQAPPLTAKQEHIYDQLNSAKN